MVIARLDLNCHCVISFNTATKREVFDRAADICHEHGFGGVLELDGVDYGEFDYGIELVFTELATGNQWYIVK